MYVFITNLLHPFTLLFLIVAIALVNLWQKRKDSGFRLLLLIVPFALLTLFCLPAIADLSVGVFERQFPILQKRPADAGAIVVLCAGIYPPDKVLNKTRPGEMTLCRCIRAAELYHQGTPCTVVVSGGKVDPCQAGEPCALVMRNFMINMGVHESDLLVECTSKDTYENAVESYRLLKKRGIEKIVLVTDAVHLYRASLCFRNIGFTVIPAGCNYTAHQFRFSLFRFLPSVGAAGKNQRVFHELMGLLWFRLRGLL